MELNEMEFVSWLLDVFHLQWYSWRLPALKKQLKKFQELCTIPCALGLENLTALQRRNLDRKSVV